MPSQRVNTAIAGALPVTQHPQTASSVQNVTFGEGKRHSSGVRGPWIGGWGVPSSAGSRLGRSARMTVRGPR